MTKNNFLSKVTIPCLFAFLFVFSINIIEFNFLEEFHKNHITIKELLINFENDDFFCKKEHWHYINILIILLFSFFVFSTSIFLVLINHYRFINKRLLKKSTYKNRYENIGESMDKIAHQWKQPLNELSLVMMINERILEKDDISEIKIDIRKQIAKANNIIQFMGRTIDTFKELVKANDDIKVFNVLDYVEKVLTLVQDDFNILMINLLIDTTEKELFINGNATDFSHILLSILVNSKDAFLMKNEVYQKEIRIKISKEKNNCLITISDNAGGIKIKPISKVFELNVTTKNGSNGLGLYITKEIVKKFRGEIYAKSFENKSFFLIYLPLSEKNKL